MKITEKVILKRVEKLKHEYILKHKYYPNSVFISQKYLDMVKNPEKISGLKPIEVNIPFEEITCYFDEKLALEEKWSVLSKSISEFLSNYPKFKILADRNEITLCEVLIHD